MTIKTVERLPRYERKQRSDIQRLIRDFVRSGANYALIVREEGEYPNGGKLEVALRNAVKAMDLAGIIDIICIGNDVYLKMLRDRDSVKIEL